MNELDASFQAEKELQKAFLEQTQLMDLEPISRPIFAGFLGVCHPSL